MSDDNNTLDGRTLLAWRAEYVELVDRFIEYADHKPSCIHARAGHLHLSILPDSRMVCRAAPCTCGVLIILGVLAPYVTWGIECPDTTTPIPLRFLYPDQQ